MLPLMDRHDPVPIVISPIRNKSVPKIIINDTIIFLLNCNQHFGNFKPYLTVSESCLIKLVPKPIFYLKIYWYFSIGNGQPPSEPALYQLYGLTFVPCCSFPRLCSLVWWRMQLQWRRRANDNDLQSWNALPSLAVGYIESAEQSRTAEHFWLAAYSASKSDNKPV